MQVQSGRVARDGRPQAREEGRGLNSRSSNSKFMNLEIPPFFIYININIYDFSLCELSWVLYNRTASENVVFYEYILFSDFTRDYSVCMMFYYAVLLYDDDDAYHVTTLSSFLFYVFTRFSFFLYKKKKTTSVIKF